MTRPTEGDWECAYRVLKNCQPHDHGAGALVVEYYRQCLVAQLVAEVHVAYDTGHVAEWLRDQEAQLTTVRAPAKSSRARKI